ncbi:hypothetical protein [Pseudonocardia asaccharolytica]|uniref:Zinc-finger domain-containing protein n=1 Tax=Pseudonocardia asaccharolytica DSM 44247 = NBRC 16224 TaxID=1123024 RepID=A0A511D1M6_9PSEU|nr:hypothetical protein [Pseudonocardia asaccharolytica]GEL18587.1 hypothetical protein PA7_24240 [Pseudonocardia asaccharolytica DSM 44247 = NBRC 16224]
MTHARRRFSVGTPDWGEGHLTLDAIVAFVDDELAAGAHSRATQHLDHCAECAEEVVAQIQARSALRSAAAPSMPSSLLSSLRSIPQDTDLPEPPAGLAMTTDGQFVTMLRPHPSDCFPSPAAPAPAHGRRRIRLGAGAAVTGLALGALVLITPSASVDSPPADRGVLGGPVLGGTVPAALDTRFEANASRASPAAGTAPELADLARRLDMMAPVFSAAHLR